MARLWVVTVMGAFGCLVAIAGAALAVGAVVAIVAGWVLVALRYAPDWNVGLLPLVLPLQMVVAGWVVRGVLKRDPRPLLYVLLAAGAGSFLALYGWYFLLLGQGFELIAYGNLLYLVAGLLVVPAALLGDTQGSGEGGRGPMVRGSGATVRMLGTIFFLAVGVAAAYAAMPPMPPEPEMLSLADEPSCPRYLDEEIAALRGSGDRTSSAFKTPGYWGYEYASTGYGTMSIRILAETGDVVYGSDEPLIRAGSGGGGDFALGPGTFRLDIRADDDAKYAVVVCGEANPSGSNRGGPVQQSDSREQIPSAPDEPVPDVVGMNPEEACATLGQSGYRGVFEGEPVDDPSEPGGVVGQHPQPGVKDFGERLVRLLVSRSSSGRPLEPPPGCVNSPG